MSKPIETLRRLALHEFGSHEPMRRALEFIETPATGEAVVVVSAGEPLPLYRKPRLLAHRSVPGGGKWPFARHEMPMKGGKAT